MRLDVESLRALQQVIDADGVCRAAERLNLSQSAVSHKLKRLETKVGRPLFQRQDGQLNLTDDGLHLYQYAQRILNLHDEAVSFLTPSGIKGEIRLGSTENITLSGLAPVLSRFRHQHPNTNLKIQVEQSLVLQQWLRQGSIDLALLQLESDQLQPDDVLLWEDELIWVSAPDRDWSDQPQLPLITFGPNCFYYPHIQRALRSQNRDYIRVLECPSHAGVFSAVFSGLGISVLNQRSVPAGLIQLETEKFGFLPKISYVARRLNQQSSPAIDSLLEALQLLAKRGQFNSAF